MPYIPTAATHTAPLRVRYREGGPIQSYSANECQARFGFHLLSHLAFADSSTYIQVKRDIVRAIRHRHLPEYAERFGIAFRRQVDAGIGADLLIQWINERIGYGTFASAPLAAGTFVGEYSGVVRRCSRFFGNTNAFCFRYPLPSWSWFIYTIDAASHGNPTRFINHDPLSPNCNAVTTINNDLLHICIYANRTIAAGEELTFDYGNNRESMR